MSDTFEQLNPGENQGASIPAGAPGANASSQPQNTPLENAGSAAVKAMSGVPGGERRRRRRALISAPVRVRSVDLTEDGPDEVSTTLDVSRNGLLFASSRPDYAVGTTVAVTFPYTKEPIAALAEQEGRVARVTQMPDGRWSVAIALGVGVGEDIVDAAGRTLISKTPALKPGEKAPEKPLVMVVDADLVIRETLKTYLGNEGYEVIALSCAAEAHQALDMFTPALLIAEIEGEDLPGYELCAHVKSTPRLMAVPVMLLTSSAYPSDYSNAHSLGAVVCMAKPYRQDRLGHKVRLLAPTQQAKNQTAPVRPADESRRACSKKKGSPAVNSVQARRDNGWLW